MQKVNTQPEVVSDTVNVTVKDQSLAEVIKAVEAKYLGHVLTEAGGNKTKAAELAGISRDAFRRKLALYSIKAVYCVD